MFKLLQKLFQKKESFIPRIREESWETDFSKQKKRRWQQYSGDDQELFFDKNGMHLRTCKTFKSVWQNQTPEYEYKDLILEAAIFLRTGNLVEQKPAADREDGVGAGLCAAGILFRNTGTTYYSVLLSSGGYIRMDAVFNGNPLPLLGWREVSSFSAIDSSADTVNGNNVLRIAARGTRFLLMVNDALVAEIDDDTIQSTGAVSCVLQNWGEVRLAEAVYTAVHIDSRRSVLESVFDRCAAQSLTTEQYVRNAESLFSVGRALPALAELRKIPPEQLFSGAAVLASRIYQSQHLYQEARITLEQLPEFAKKVTNDSALAECYAEVLYLLNDFSQLTSFIINLTELPEPRVAVEQSAVLQNLAGHAAFETQRWAKALYHYARAAELQPDQGIFSLNAARALDKMKNAKTDNDSIATDNFAQTAGTSVDFYVTAAEAFLNDENYEDLAAVIPLLKEHISENPRAAAIAGKYYYAAGVTDDAGLIFDQLISTDNADASIWYLSGLLHRNNGEKERGRTELAKAAALEPGYPLFRCRYAEALMIDGDLPGAEAETVAALEQDVTFGWTLNLAASLAFQKGDCMEAAGYSKKAREALPAEFPVLENYVHIMTKNGMAEEMLRILDCTGIFFDEQTEDPAAAANPGKSYNLGANLLVDQDDLDTADTWYLQALTYEPENSEFLVNRATLCLKMRRYNEADSLLAKAHECGPSADIYRLIGYLAARKGDFARSEVSYRQGIEDFPDVAGLYYDLARLYDDTGRHEKAAETLIQLQTACPAEIETPEYANLAEKLHNYTHRTLSCSLCAHQWHIPRNIPLQAPLHLAAEPPDDMPAGMCLECGRSFCIGCAKKSIDENGRFICASCGGRLKLADQGFIWLLRQWMAESGIQEL